MPSTTGTLFGKQSFDAADEVRTFAHGHLDIVTVGDHTVGRATFNPGWKWSESIRPIVQTDLCETEHLGCITSGRMRVRMRDGTETEYGPGDAMYLSPGHDAWVVGTEPCIAYDFIGLKDYAKK